MTIFKPDFYIVPRIIKDNKKLQPKDGDVYAVVYWFERLKDGRCTAKNETIAGILNCNSLSVANSLKRLEDCGYIQRIFKDKTKRIRLEIKTLVSFVYHQPMKQVSSNDDTAQTESVSSNDEQNKKDINNNRNKSGTPYSQASIFFEAIEDGDEKIISFASQLATKYQISQLAALNELQAFRNWWTELDQTGRKERWQVQKFFQINRRLATWFSKIKNNKFSKPKGKTII